MKVLVDTCIWSLALRRRSGDLDREEQGLCQRLKALIEDDLVVMCGPVRQELLSGISGDALFVKLRNTLKSFDDEPLCADDYEDAAKASNACRKAGISGSSVDYLLCSIAIRRNLAVFTVDRDFERYSTVLKLKLYK